MDSRRKTLRPGKIEKTCVVGLSIPFAQSHRLAYMARLCLDPIGSCDQPNNKVRVLILPRSKSGFRVSISHFQNLRNERTDHRIAECSKTNVDEKSRWSYSRLTKKEGELFCSCLSIHGAEGVVRGYLSKP